MPCGLPQGAARSDFFTYQIKGITKCLTNQGPVGWLVGWLVAKAMPIFAILSESFLLLSFFSITF